MFDCGISNFESCLFAESIKTDKMILFQSIPMPFFKIIFSSNYRIFTAEFCEGDFEIEEVSLKKTFWIPRCCTATSQLISIKLRQK